MYKPWADLLTANCELYSVQLPGRDSLTSEEPISDIKPLVERLFTAISPFLNIPYVFIGHSLGAIVSYSLINKLRLAGHKEPLLFIPSARHGPKLPERNKQLHNLSDSEIIQNLKRYDGLPDGLLDSPEMASIYLPRIRADFSVTENYRFQNELPFDCPILAIGGDRDKAVNINELTAWGAHTTTQFSCKQFSGGHFFIFEQQSRVVSYIMDEVNLLLELNRTDVFV